MWESIIQRRTPRNRVRIDVDGSRLELRISSIRNWWAIAFLLYWLHGLGSILQHELPELFSSSDGGVSPWRVLECSGWIAGGLVAVAWLIWMFLGWEKIVIDGRRFVLCSSLGFWYHTRTLPLGECGGVHLWLSDPGSSKAVRWSCFPFGPGRGFLVLDACGKRLRFGRCLSAREAHSVAKLLSERITAGTTGSPTRKE